MQPLFLCTHLVLKQFFLHSYIMPCLTEFFLVISLLNVFLEKNFPGYFYSSPSSEKLSLNSKKIIGLPYRVLWYHLAIYSPAYHWS